LKIYRENYAVKGGIFAVPCPVPVYHSLLSLHHAGPYLRWYPRQAIWKQVCYVKYEE